MGCLGWLILGPFIGGGVLVAATFYAAFLLLLFIAVLAYRACRRQPLLQHRGWLKGPLGRAL
jgi:hypothetical protein